MTRAWIFAAIACLTGCMTQPTFAPAPTEATPSTSYLIGAPDRLRITILPDPAVERDVVVRLDGMISIDLVGDVPAAGRTAADVAQDIQERMARFKRNASVTVSVLTSLSTEITVLGEVGRPSTFPLTGNTNLIKALGMVGGTSRFANKEAIRVIRVDETGTPRVFQANLAAIELGDLSTNFALRGGDVIVVPPTGTANAGYMMQRIFFPLQQILGLGANVATTVVTGGANAAF